MNWTGPQQKIDYFIQLHQDPKISDTITYTIIKTRNQIKPMRNLFQELKDNVENWIQTQAIKEQNQEQETNYWPKVRAEAQTLFVEAASACRAFSKEGGKDLIWGKITDKNVAVHVEQLLRAEGLAVRLMPVTPTIPYYWFSLAW